MNRNIVENWNGSVIVEPSHEEDKANANWIKGSKFQDCSSHSRSCVPDIHSVTRHARKPSVITRMQSWLSFHVKSQITLQTTYYVVNKDFDFNLRFQHHHQVANNLFSFMHEWEIDGDLVRVILK